MKNGWHSTKLRDVCRLINGRAYKKPELLPEGKYPVLRVGNFFTNNHWYYSDLELDSDKYCDSGDLLYAWSASFGPRIWNGGKVIYHYHIWKVEPNARIIDKRFLFLWFLWDTEQIKEDQGTGTTMIHVAKGAMEDRDIAIPPIPEQRRIVGILDEAFAGIATAKAHAEQNLQNARALFESHLNAVFTQRGDGWMEKTIGELLEEHGGEIKTGPFGTKLKASEYTETGVPVISVGEIRLGEIVLHHRTPRVDKTITDRMPEYVLKEGDIVFGRKGGVERSACVKADQAGWFLGSDGIRLRLPKNCNRRFIAYQLLEPSHKNWMVSHSVGTTMPSLNQKIIAQIPIALCSIQSQHAIVNALDSSSDETQRLESIYQRKLAALDELKKSLLHQAFTGEI